LENYLFFVTAETFNIRLNPFQRRQLILKSQVESAPVGS
jgi:hypothetical protein